MIPQGLYDHSAYDQDNSKLWEILQVLLKQSKQYVLIRIFAERRNGRAAYLALTTQKLGSNCWEDVIATAETMLDNSCWD